MEPRCNDAKELVYRFGGKLVLYSGGDNRSIIPDGSVDDVRRHVKSQFEMLGKRGRFEYSTHDIPSHRPQETLDASFEMFKSCRC